MFGFSRFAVSGGSQRSIASLCDDRIDGDAGDGGDPESGGGGSQPTEDDAHADDGEDGGPARNAGAGDDSDDDDDDVDPIDPATGRPLSAEEQVKKMRTALKSAKKKLAKARGASERISDLQRRGLNLDDMYAESRQYRELNAVIQGNPRLQRMLLGGDGDEGATDRGGKRQPAEPEFTFDESPEALGFDANDKAQPANRVLANGLRDVAMLKHQLAGLIKDLGGDPKKFVGRVGQIEGGLQQSRTQSLEREWVSTINAAAVHIKDEGQRDMFTDLMKLAYAQEAGKRSPQQLVTHYLRKLRIDPGQAQRANKAAAAPGAKPGAPSPQHTAQRVAQLPRHHTAGQPAPARNRTENVRDVGRRLRSSVSA